MLSKSVIRDVLRVSCGNYVCGILMIIIFLALKKFDLTVLSGAFLGCTFSSLSFLFLAFSLERSVGAGTNTAKAKMTSSYTIRLISAGIMIFWAIKAPYFNHWAAIIPLFFQRFVINILTIIDNRKGGNTREC